MDTVMMETPHKTKTFEPFSSLPKELRLEIWELALPASRLIRISLKPHEGRRYNLAAAVPRYQHRNALGNPISGERYRAVVQGGHQGLHSKFLRINQEARAAALRFYRVHVPGVYLAGPSCTARGTLYLNPEHDVLHVAADAPVRETLIDFFWDLKAYDPRGVGLLRLAVDLESFCANDLQYLRRSDLLLIRHRSALVETLAGLREVWFVNVPSSGRTSSSSSDSAVPVLVGGGPTFRRMGRDARGGLEQELAQVYLGHIDPRELVFRWRRVLRTWGVEHAPEQVSYRLLVARTPGCGWRGLRPPWRAGELHDGVERLTLGHGGAGGREGMGVGREGEKVSAAPVFGFWLFPLEAIGAVGEGDKLSDVDFRPARVLDLRSHWPELVLSKCG